MRQLIINVYTLNEHPNKEKCFEWIRENLHDISDYIIDDYINSLKTLTDKIGGKLKYSLSVVPDRSEFVSITDYDTDKLKLLYDNLSIDECPLTGVCCDKNVIESIYLGNNKLIDDIHDEHENNIKDESLLDRFYDDDFYENGKKL